MVTDPDAVVTKDDLVRFVKSLREDLLRNPGDWENPELERFLEALAAWIAGCDGYYRNFKLPFPHDVTWKFTARALAAASIYE